MAQKIVPGKYTANIIDYGIGQTKSGNPQVMILMNYLDSEGDSHEITWFGSLKEGKAQEITIETLLKCGIKGNDIAGIADGVVSDLLDVVTPVTIAVIENDYEGTKSMRVQWIAKQGSGALEKRLSKQEAGVKLGALNLKGAVMKARQDTGMKDEPRRPAPTHIREPGDDFDGVFGPA